jgi:hypothetical protein
MTFYGSMGSCFLDQVTFGRFFPYQLSLPMFVGIYDATGCHSTEYIE